MGDVDTAIFGKYNVPQNANYLGQEMKWLASLPRASHVTWTENGRIWVVQNGCGDSEVPVHKVEVGGVLRGQDKVWLEEVGGTFLTCLYGSISNSARFQN